MWAEEAAALLQLDIKFVYARTNIIYGIFLYTRDVGWVSNIIKTIFKIIHGDPFLC